MYDITVRSRANDEKVFWFTVKIKGLTVAVSKAKYNKHDSALKAANDWTESDVRHGH